MNALHPLRLLASLSIVVATLAHQPAAGAADDGPGVVLASGVVDGGYWNAGERLREVAATEFGLAVENRPSDGSLDNLEKLLDPDSPVGVAFAQADAVQYYPNQHPDDVTKLELYENVGQECVFILTGRDSELRTDDDLRDEDNLQLGIASAASGTAITYKYLVSQMPELEDITVDYGDTASMMAGLDGPNPSVDAVMTVHRPKELSPEVTLVLNNPERYRFVELGDDSLTEKLWFGREVYRSMALVMPGAREPVQTICVLGLLLGNKLKLTLDQRNQLNDLADYHWMNVYVAQ